MKDRATPDKANPHYYHPDEPVEENDGWSGPMPNKELKPDFFEVEKKEPDDMDGRVCIWCGGIDGIHGGQCRTINPEDNQC